MLTERNKVSEDLLFFLDEEKNKKIDKTDLPVYTREFLNSYYIPNVKELTKKGIINGSYCGPVSDGTTYILEYKVGDTYNIIYIGNTDSYFKRNPDQQMYRRQYEITKLFCQD